jgi:hypothetical protein
MPPTNANTTAAQCRRGCRREHPLRSPPGWLRVLHESVGDAGCLMSLSARPPAKLVEHLSPAHLALARPASSGQRMVSVASRQHRADRAVTVWLNGTHAKSVEAPVEQNADSGSAELGCVVTEDSPLTQTRMPGWQNTTNTCLRRAQLGMGVESRRALSARGVHSRTVELPGYRRARMRSAVRPFPAVRQGKHRNSDESVINSAEGVPDADG